MSKQPLPTHPTPEPSVSSQIVGAKPGKQLRGFAAMTREKQHAIASRGGKASHAAGTGHEWTAEEASAAGKKGGRASATKRAAAHRSRKQPRLPGV